METIHPPVTTIQRSVFLASPAAGFCGGLFASFTGCSNLCWPGVASEPGAQWEATMGRPVLLQLGYVSSAVQGSPW